MPALVLQCIIVAKKNCYLSHLHHFQKKCGIGKEKSDFLLYGRRFLIIFCIVPMFFLIFLAWSSADPLGVSQPPFFSQQLFPSQEAGPPFPPPGRRKRGSFRQALVVPQCRCLFGIPSLPGPFFVTPHVPLPRICAINVGCPGSK